MQQKGEEMKRVVSKEIKENHIIGRVESKDPEIKEKIKKAIHRMNRQGIPISYDLVFQIGRASCRERVSACV